MCDVLFLCLVNCKIMNFNFMYFIVKRLALLCVLFVGVSCANGDIYEDFENKPDKENAGVELRLGIPATRATLDDDLNLRWQRGDRIYFMAYTGSTQLCNKEASFWANLMDDSSYGHPQAYFKAKFDATAEATVLESLKSITDGKCYAVSPVKGVTINGTTATMTIPSVQTGEYSSACDFMTARSGAVEGLKLSTGNNDDYVNDVDLIFEHHTHAFRVIIPGNNLGKEIAKAYIKFPFAVVGDVTVDFTTGAVSATNTKDLVTVEFVEPKSAGDEFWVFINGVEDKGAVDLRFQATDGTFTERRLAKFTQQNWSAGKISKISMSVPQAVTYTTIRSTVPDYSRLGEEVTNLHLSLAAGYFTDYATTQNAPKDANGIFQYMLFSDIVDDSFRSANHTLTFESTHAIVPLKDPVVFGTSLTPGAVNSYELTAPYVFEEDFSTIQSYSRDDRTGAQGTAVTAYDLTAYGLTSGWSGARTGGEVGQSIRVGSRVDRVWGYTHTYGRLDSPSIANLKQDVSANVVVTFNYSGGIDGDSGYSPRAVCGYTTTAGLINGKSGSFSSDADDWENILGTQLVPSISTDGSYTSVPQSTSYIISGCQRTYRLSWMIRGAGEGGFISNGNQWMFIDNVRVSIAQ